MAEMLQPGCSHPPTRQLIVQIAGKLCSIMYGAMPDGAPPGWECDLADPKKRAAWFKANPCVVLICEVPLGGYVTEIVRTG